jgi:hypothetical protein
MDGLRPPSLPTGPSAVKSSFNSLLLDILAAPLLSTIPCPWKSGAAHLGGEPRRGIYDNMRSAVDKVGRGKERTVNARFLAMASHYLFEAEFCNPAAGWEKGQVEKNVQDARHRLWQSLPWVESLEALNALAGTALPGAMGPDPARQRTGHDRGCLGQRGREPHAHGPVV